MSLTLCPLTLKQANDYVAKNHRHHPTVTCYKFAIGCKDGGELCGVVIVGRPVARNNDDGFTCEVTRLCTDGTKNACSILYANAWKAARSMGYRKIITYILYDEPGTSLLAAGFKFDGVTDGGSWSRPSRERTQKAPICKKKRYIKEVK